MRAVDEAMSHLLILSTQILPDLGAALVNFAPHTVGAATRVLALPGDGGGGADVGPAPQLPPPRNGLTSCLAR